MLYGLRKAVIASLAAMLLVSGCAATKSLFTNPTGLITIERSQFLSTYAVVKVLYKRLRAQAAAACVENTLPRKLDQIDCAELAAIDRKVKALDIQIQAKIEVPESEIDWAVVKDLLGAIVGLVP
jgi:hypothetical protein